jgi:hypothetical protein
MATYVEVLVLPIRLVYLDGNIIGIAAWQKHKNYNINCKSFARRYDDGTPTSSLVQG